MPANVGLAPVLLSVPPFVPHDLVLGTVSVAWSGIEPRALDCRDEPVIRSVWEERIGDTFWAPDALAQRATILCVPTNLKEAEALWATAKTGRLASTMVVIFPDRSRHWHALRARVLVDGGAVVCQPVNPFSLLEQARDILTMPGAIQPLAALGAMAGLPLWILDPFGRWPSAPDADARGQAAALLLDATQYRCPFTGKAISVQDAVGLLIEWRDIMRRNRAVSVCVGMAWWKRNRIGDFFATADTRRPKPLFRRDAKLAVSVAQRLRGRVAVWSTRMPGRLEQYARMAGVGVCRVEDGFIRSAGLGSGLLPPASIVVDTSGIYYDPTGPSDLETLLESHPLGPDLQIRAGRLVDRMIGEGVSKYALGGTVPDLAAPPGRKIVLVPGQVADDLSVVLGGAGMDGNLDLLCQVRASEPEAYIVYRPHPDVDAGHRSGTIPDAVVLRFADCICREGAMARLLDIVHEVHTLTSLTGFEALMRRKPVTTYGQPFYAGWGLTHDRVPVARRTRCLNMEQLAAATLLLYPRYIDPLTRMPCGPEILVGRFGEAELWRPSLLMRLRRHQGTLVKAIRKGGQSVFRRLSPHRGF